MLTNGLLGAISDQVGGLERLEHARRGPRRVRALEAHAVDLVPVPARDEPLLERRSSPAGVSSHVRSRSSVAGSSVGSSPKRTREPGGHGRERLAATQRLRAHEVEPEVAVAEPEPALAAELDHGLERVPASRPRGPSPAPRPAGR